MPSQSLPIMRRAGRSRGATDSESNGSAVMLWRGSSWLGIELAERATARSGLKHHRERPQAAEGLADQLRRLMTWCRGRESDGTRIQEPGVPRRQIGGSNISAGRVSRTLKEASM